MPSYDKLSASGGGFKGVSQLGSLHYFYERGDFKNLKEYSGTSIGSVECLLLSCGYTPLELYEYAVKFDYFLGISSINILLLWQDYGGIEMTPFTNEIDRLVRKKLDIDYTPTFKQLEKLTGKTLHITVANNTKMTTEYFNSSTQPDLSVIEGMAMSCNIPGVFLKMKHNGCYYVDGGLGDHCGLEPLIGGGGKILSIVTEGFGVDLSVDNLMTYHLRNFLLPMRELERLRSLSIPQGVDTITIESSDVSFMEFASSETKKKELFIAGYNAAKKFCNNEERFAPEDDGWNDEWDIWE